MEFLIANPRNELVPSPELAEPKMELLMPTTPPVVKAASREPVISQRLGIVCELIAQIVIRPPENGAPEPKPKILPTRTCLKFEVEKVRAKRNLLNPPLHLFMMVNVVYTSRSPLKNVRTNELEKSRTRKVKRKKRLLISFQRVKGERSSGLYVLKPEDSDF